MYVISGELIEWHQGDKFAIAVNDCLNSIGLKSEIRKNTDGIDKNEMIMVIDVRSMKDVRVNWKGPVILYNLLEAYGEFSTGIKRIKRWIRALKNRRVNYVFDYSPLNFSELKKSGFNPIYTPIGYHESFELKKIDTPVYDISFTGVNSKIRDRFIRKLQEIFNMHVFGFLPKKRGFSEESFKSKIYLHINRTDLVRNFPSARIIQLYLSNKMPVISDKTEWSPIVGDGVHYDTFDNFEDLVSKIRYYLEHEKERVEMGRRGYDYIKSKYRLEDHLKDALTEAKLV